MKPSATSWSVALMRSRTRRGGGRSGQRPRLFTLGLVPQRVHLAKCGVLQRAALRFQRTFDEGKPALEFAVGGAQCLIGIGADVPRQINQREQEIAGFLGKLLCVAAVERRLDLVSFLANLMQHRARVVPVETDGR